jgi:hypothetical protein
MVVWLLLAYQLAQGRQRVELPTPRKDQIRG